MTSPDEETDGQIDYVNKKIYTKSFFFTRNGRIDSNQILHVNSFGDVVIYMTWHRNWLRGFGGVGMRKWAFPIDFRVQNFADLATFSVDFCILYSECPPYFYFRFVWVTDLEIIPQASTHTSIIPTKFEAPTRSVLELWVITFPLAYHWKCVRCHCACAESRDPWVGGQKLLHFWNPRPWFAYSLCNFYWATTTIKRRMSFCACAKSSDLLKVP